MVRLVDGALRSKTPGAVSDHFRQSSPITSEKPDMMDCCNSKLKNAAVITEY